jgi:hypothetical protein
VTTPESLKDVAAMEAGRTFFKLKSFFLTPDAPLKAAAFEAMMAWVARAEKSGVAYVLLDILGPKVGCLMHAALCSPQHQHSPAHHLCGSQ